MTLTKRILKRASALMLCAVLLSGVLMCFVLPIHAAAPTTISFGDDLIESLLSMTESDYRTLISDADLMMGIGAVQHAINTGSYTEIQVINLKTLLEHLKQAREARAAVAGGGAAGAAYYTAAKTAVMPWLIGGLKVAGVTALMTDWTQVIAHMPTRYHPVTGEEIFSVEDHQAWIDAHIAPISNPFYNWAGNYNWVTSLYMDILSDREYDTRADKNAHYWELTQSGWESINGYFRGIFGGNSGKQELPAYDMFQAFEAMSIIEITNWEPYSQYRNGLSHIYNMPMGAVIKCSYGQYVGLRLNSREWNGFRWVWFDIPGIDARVATTYSNLVNGVMMEHFGLNYGKQGIMSVVIMHYPEGVGHGYPSNFDIVVRPVHIVGNGVTTGFGVMYMSSAELGLPAVPYINNIDHVRDQIDRMEDKLDNLLFQLPAIVPTDDPYIDFFDWMQEMQGWDPLAVSETGTEPGTGTGTGTDPDTDDPDDEEEDNSHFHLFPFCIPFDVVNMVKGLAAAPEAPKWEIPFGLPSALHGVMGGETVSVEVDLSFLEQIMPFVRLLILAGFIVGLARVTSVFIKW